MYKKLKEKIDEKDIDFESIKNYYSKYNIKKKWYLYNLDINEFEDININKKTNEMFVFLKKFINDKHNYITYILSCFFAIFLRILFVTIFMGCSYLFLYLLGNFTNLKINYIIFIYMWYNIIIICIWARIQKIQFYFKDEMIAKKWKYHLNNFFKHFIDIFTHNICFWWFAFLFLRNEYFVKNENCLNADGKKMKDNMEEFCELTTATSIFFTWFYFNQETNTKFWFNKNIEKKIKKHISKKMDYFEDKKMLNDKLPFLILILIISWMIKKYVGFFFVPVFLSLFAALIYFYA